MSGMDVQIACTMRVQQTENLVRAVKDGANGKITSVLIWVNKYNKSTN